MDEVVSPDLSALIYEQVRKFVARQAPASGDHPGAEISAGPVQTTASELALLKSAYQRKVLYVVGEGQMRILKSHNVFRRVMLWTFLWIRSNTRAKVASLRLAMDKVVEVGFVKDI
ncbi:hypothetical protein HYQ44_011065 [Verticillium longisporum]|nr:hypothetical protein HYQ44_011065 [Verticillium longisporum]